MIVQNCAKLGYYCMSVFISYGVGLCALQKAKDSKDDSLESFVPKAGLEPARAQCPRDFKSLVSTIPPFRQPVCLSGAKL